MTHFERAILRPRADNLNATAPDRYTTRCGRILRSPEAIPVEPDAKTVDHIIAIVCAIGIVVMIGLLILEKVAV